MFVVPRSFFGRRLTPRSFLDRHYAGHCHCPHHYHCCSHYHCLPLLQPLPLPRPLPLPLPLTLPLRCSHYHCHDHCHCMLSPAAFWLGSANGDVNGGLRAVRPGPQGPRLQLRGIRLPHQAAPHCRHGGLRRWSLLREGHYRSVAALLPHRQTCRQGHEARAPACGMQAEPLRARGDFCMGR